MNRRAVLLAGAGVCAAIAVSAHLHGARASLAPTAHGAADGDESPAGDGAPVDPATEVRVRELAELLARARPAWGAGEAVAAPVATPDFPEMPVVPLDDEGHTRVDPRYLRRRVREGLTPLVMPCYRAALARDPTLAGRLVVRYRVQGNRRIGGVVDEARLVRGTTIEDAALRTCVTESMLSLAFDAPPGDAEVVGGYALDLSPDDVAAEG